MTATRVTQGRSSAVTPTGRFHGVRLRWPKFSPVDSLSGAATPVAVYRGGASEPRCRTTASARPGVGRNTTPERRRRLIPVAAAN